MNVYTVTEFDIGECEILQRDIEANCLSDAMELYRTSYKFHNETVAIRFDLT